MWECPNCRERTLIGVAIGDPVCSIDGSTLVLIKEAFLDEANMPLVSIGAGGKISVDGNLHNSGKIKVFPNGEIHVSKDLFNTGDISVNDPEKIKELLVELVKTSGNVAELGSNIIKTFFKIYN